MQIVNCAYQLAFHLLFQLPHYPFSILVTTWSRRKPLCLKSSSIVTTLTMLVPPFSLHRPRILKTKNPNTKITFIHRYVVFSSQNHQKNEGLLLHYTSIGLDFLESDQNPWKLEKIFNPITLICRYPPSF